MQHSTDALIFNRENQLNQLKTKYLAKNFSLGDIYLCYQTYQDLIIVKKWDKVEFNNTDDFIYIMASHSTLPETSIIIPCKSFTDWSISKIKTYFNELSNSYKNDNINIKDPRSFVLAIQDEDSSIVYYQLSEEISI
ncbi:hypothetical protein DLAC_11702 [Tieghemostelium lacteum]|uniref:tRNA-splicing endonuclease subunit Sen15 domain-containing protein n=1 Tax=Tieghemostelium lacteum TaxID=361077 RepID=A0A151ZAU1_TIELA|nr:hypothetical protein DLAC_11702 [Tieghemostelium lacteum]|eukprot:KYQ91051.1 hypothetical protein DLAC_11702 [Tieghemostelium lacteum]